VKIQGQLIKAFGIGLRQVDTLSTTLQFCAGKGDKEL